MIKVKSADKTYNYYISTEKVNLFGGILSYLESYKHNKIAIITDENVANIYLNQLKKVLSDFKVFDYIIAGGEESKCISTVNSICEFLAENEFDRSDIILALGGGIVGDTAGFVASIYKRGIKYVQIPTTLLAQIDSSVGGKTGVNLKQGKNLIGAFYQPEFVYAELATLDTLPEIEIKNGLGEAIKYSAICDAKLADLLLDYKTNINEIIARCVEIKAQIVETDTYDNGKRQLLNFGHTFGHAIEKASNYTIRHGIAVCLGMLKITRSTEFSGNTNKGTYDKLLNLVQKLGLPTEIEFDDDTLKKYISNDKKIKNGDLTMVYLIEFGKANLVTYVSILKLL